LDSTSPTKEVSPQAERVQALLKKADGHYRQGHRRRAVWNYRKVLKADPGNVTALVNLGLIYSMSKDKHVTARQMLERASELEPENPAVLFNLATLSAQAGDAAHAMTLLEQAEALSPDYPDLHYNKAHLLAQEGRLEEGLQEVERELKNNPGNMNALIMQKAIEERLKGNTTDPTGRGEASPGPVEGPAEL